MARRAEGRQSRRNGRQTRVRILDVATSSFARGGYEATSLRQIAGAAEIDLATLKYHFGDKPGLYGQVYQAGHTKFLATIGPILADMGEIRSSDHVRGAIATLATAATGFILDEQPFVRMYLYRLLEPEDHTDGLEKELQVTAVALVQSTFQRLAAAGIIREIDAPTFTLSLLTGLAMTVTAALSRPDWLQPPGADTGAGRVRLESALRDALERTLLP
jgi:AcrR family transcriptional regulator